MKARYAKVNVTTALYEVLDGHRLNALYVVSPGSTVIVDDYEAFLNMYHAVTPYAVEGYIHADLIELGEEVQ